MRRTGKRGQAAMEFLMTYGWAILAAIVVIGILGYYYFGSDILTPKGGVVTAPFYLNAQNANPSAVLLELKNNGGETYSITSVDVAGCGTNSTTIAMVDGGIEVINVTCGTALISGDTFSGDITITYRKSGSSLDQKSTGSLTEVVG